MSTQRASHPQATASATNVFRSFQVAWNSGDLDAFARQWTKEAMFWPPDGADLRGPDVIRNWAKQLGPAPNLQIEVLFAEQLDDSIFAVGNFTQDVRLQGNFVHFRGGFAGVLRDTGQGLKVHRLVSFQERAVPR